jgi:hypothetical protein
MKPFTMTLLIFVVATAVVGGSDFAQAKVAHRKKVSFDENYERYPSPYDLFFHLERMLPATSKEYSSAECQRLGEENTTVLGGNLPNFGAPLENEPGALFTELYVKCFDFAFNTGLRGQNAGENYQAILGEPIYMKMLAKTRSTTPASISSIAWKDVEKAERIEILSRLAEYTVGPDEILEEKDLFGTDSVFGPEVRTKADLLALLERKGIENKSYPTLYDIVRSTAILLRLGPTVLKQ